MYDYYTKFVEEQAKKDLDEINELLSEINDRIRIRILNLKSSKIYSDDILDLGIRQQKFYEKYPHGTVRNSVNPVILSFIDSLVQISSQLSSRIDILELENVVIKKKNEELEDRIAKLEQLVTPKSKQKNKNWRRKNRNKNKKTIEQQPDSKESENQP